MRQDIDEQVATALSRADGAMTATDIAAAFGLTSVGATHCLQRLVKAGRVTVTAETVVKPGRVSEIVLHYQTKPRKSMGLPAWLDPRRVPDAVAGVRRYMQPMTWAGDEECERAA